ncbi:MAG: NAD(P)/FAD-dependent oxidoreductase [Pseudomonadota bacterium]
MSNPRVLSADYVIVGSGAVGMAFADVILAESAASVIIIDLHQKAGGHWNDAYPFVSLHQPSEFYGVSSRELSNGRRDQVGLNKGLSELASGAEVSAYFDDVMRHQFLPSGRVQYFPMCRYESEGRFTSLVSGAEFHATANRKFVDATYLKTAVPSRHTPNFTIEDGVNFIPLNDLPLVQDTPEGYTIVGGGKTGIDACLWLLENHVDPGAIRWIMPRDAWLLDRRNTQPSEEFFEYSIGTQARQFEALSQAQSIPELFVQLEQCGALVRIDDSVTPQMFHGATISQLELEELRRIKNIIRMGRVTALNNDKIILEHGVVPTASNIIHVDCSASAISNIEIKPIFAGHTITPQMVRSYQPVFSAAFIAHVELAYGDEAHKNSLCGVVPLPNHDTDWLRMMNVFMMNQFTWSQDKGLAAWLLNNRLDGFSELMNSVDDNDPQRQAIIHSIRSNAGPAFENLQTLLAQLN